MQFPEEITINITQEDIDKFKSDIQNDKYLSRCCPTVQSVKRLFNIEGVSCGYNEVHFNHNHQNFSYDVDEVGLWFIMLVTDVVSECHPDFDSIKPTKFTAKKKGNN